MTAREVDEIKATEEERAVVRTVKAKEAKVKLPNPPVLKQAS